jgi:tetratricopeptide (TPR) repeat protein
MQQRPWRFLLGFSLTASCFALAVVSLNVVVDPFRFWDLITIPRINGQRTEFSTSARMAKAQVVCHTQPASVIMGTSRAEVGLDPTHPGWSKFPGRTYDLALAGSGIKELELTLRHAVYASPHLRQVVMALDFLMFNANHEAVVFGTEVLDFDPGRLLTSPSDSCLRTFFYDADKLLWTGGVPFDIATVRHQLPDRQGSDSSLEHVLDRLPLYDRNGFRGNNFDALILVAHRDGFRSLIDTMTGKNAGQEAYYASKIWRAGPDQRYCFTRPGQPDTISVFRDIVKFARQQGIDIRFVINPIHARMLIALNEIGLWPLYENWKRSLVAVLAEDAERNHAEPFPLWDFSGFNTITTEPIPALGDHRSTMRWWWEPSHYQKATGNLMLDRVLDYGPGLAAVPPDFGVLLSPANIESRLAVTRERARAYRRDQPGEVKIVTDKVLPLIADADGTNCGYDIDALRQASSALRRGDHAPAEIAFAHAVAIHEADEHQAAALGVPDREVGFAKRLADARAGKEVPVNLANWEAYQTRGGKRSSVGDFAGAVGDYTRAIRFGPTYTALYLLRGQARMQLKNYAEAFHDFEAGLKLEPGNAALSVLKRQAGAEAAAERQHAADAARSKGDLPAAIRIYDQAIGLSPANNTLYYLRGTARLDAGDPAGAAEDFDAGLKLDPTDRAMHALEQQAQTAIARNEVGSGPTIDAAAAAKLQHDADAARSNGDVATAIRMYGEAIRVSPPNTALYYLRGTARLEEGELAGAATDFETALKLEPSNVTLLGLLKQTRAALTDGT